MFTAQLTKYIYTIHQPDYYGKVLTYQLENNKEAPKNLVFKSRTYYTECIIIIIIIIIITLVLNEKVAAPVLKTEINGRGDPLR
jgi:uncharacterized membrane protein YkgB